MAQLETLYVEEEDTASKEIRELQLKIMDLEEKISKLEKRGAKIKPMDIVSISFFATINSAIIAVTIILLFAIRSKLL